MLPCNQMRRRKHLKMQNASVLAACMTLTRSDFVENKVMKTCFLAFLLMPSARESVQSDRFFPDLKRSSSPLVGPSLSRSTQGSNHSHPSIRSLCSLQSRRDRKTDVSPFLSAKVELQWRHPRPATPSAHAPPRWRRACRRSSCPDWAQSEVQPPPEAGLDCCGLANFM